MIFVDQGIIIYRAIYFGAYDTAKQFAGEKPSILVRFCIAQVNSHYRI